MTKAFKYSEKTIGGFQIIWGAFSLFVTIWGFINLYDIGVKYHILSWEKISILKMTKTYHFEVLLSILSIISGLLLIGNKKAGWELAIITSFVSAVTVIIILLSNYYKSYMSLTYKTYSIIGNVIFIALFFFISFFLLLKPFRIKYNPTKKTWWILAIIVCLLLLDKIIFKLIV